MRKLGKKTVKLESLDLPGDIGQRMQEPRVIEMAKTLDEVGLLEEPWVRAVDGKLISGRDRTAAHLVAKRKTMDVQMVDCSDLEMSKIDKISNAHRRHDKAEKERLLLELVELFEAEEKLVIPAKVEGTTGRPKTAKGRARERAAAAAGIKPESVRMAELRQRKKRADYEAPPPIDTLGMPLGDDFIHGCRVIQRYMDEAASKIKAAQSILTQLANAQVEGVPLDAINRAKEHLKGTFEMLKTTKPKSLCPWCKGIEGVQEECAACRQTGWVGAMETIPSPLLVEGPEAIVYRDGEQVLVSDLVDFDDDTF